MFLIENFYEIPGGPIPTSSYLSNISMQFPGEPGGSGDRGQQGAGV